MIPARRSGAFLRFFTWHARGRIAKTFEAMRVHGLEAMRAHLAAGPVLVVSNHTSWWDPLVILHLAVPVLKADAYAMMDAKNLRKLPFFGWVGAFGVDLDDARDGARAIRYAARLLDHPNALVWIFPQGQERPITMPLVFREGAASIAGASHAKVIPAAIRYEHGATERPALFVSFGDAIANEGKRGERRLAQERGVEGELARIERAVRGEGSEVFETILAARPSRLAMLAERVLARLARPRLPQ